jgi:hypothetical protein
MYLNSKNMGVGGGGFSMIYSTKLLKEAGLHPVCYGIKGQYSRRRKPTARNALVAAECSLPLMEAIASFYRDSRPNLVPSPTKYSCVLPLSSPYARNQPTKSCPRQWYMLIESPLIRCHHLMAMTRIGDSRTRVSNAQLFYEGNPQKVVDNPTIQGIQDH